MNTSCCYAWNTRCRRVPNHLTRYAIISSVRRMSLPDRCQLIGFLVEWLWNWTGGFVANGVVKKRLSYITLNIALKWLNDALVKCISKASHSYHLNSVRVWEWSSSIAREIHKLFPTYLRQPKSLIKSKLKKIVFFRELLWRTLPQTTIHQHCV